MTHPTIFVDADSCASRARGVIAHEAAKRHIQAVFVANRALPLPTSLVRSGWVRQELTGQQKEAADDFITSSAKAGDIAVTRDLALAESLLAQGVAVINDKGFVFTKDTLPALLEERQLGLQMKALGVATGGKRHTYGKDDLAAFTRSFTSLLQALTCRR